MRKFAGATTPCQSKAAVTRLHALAAGGEEGRDHQDEHQRAQRHRIAQRRAAARPAGLELARRQQRAFDMRAPERLRDRIVAGWRQSRRRSRWPAGASRRCCGRAGAGRHRRSGSRSSSSGTVADRGDDDEHEPGRWRAPSGGSTSHKPSPGEREEQPERGRQRGQRRPQPFPQQAAARALERPREQGPGRRSSRSFGCSSKPSKSRSVAQGSWRICRINTLTRRQFPGHARAFMRLKPGRHAIERDQCVDFKARPHQRPFARL